MKTLKNIRIQNSIAATVIVSLLFLSSCQKEDLVTTTSGNVTTSDNAKHDPQGKRHQVHPAADARFELPEAQSTIMIKIDHIAGRTHAPDYSVSIKFDGTIIFEGRRNVAYLDTKEWRLASDKFMNVKQLFENSGFNSIENHLSELADVPMVYTTWSASAAQRSKTLFDYNDGYPEGLISLRQKAESILDLGQYIGYFQPQAAKGTVFN